MFVLVFILSFPRFLEWKAKWSTWNYFFFTFVMYAFKIINFPLYFLPASPFVRPIDNCLTYTMPFLSDRSFTMYLVMIGPCALFSSQLYHCNTNLLLNPSVKILFQLLDLFLAPYFHFYSFPFFLMFMFFLYIIEHIYKT